MKKNIVITGSEGLIGRDIANYFQELKGYNVKTLDLKTGTDFTCIESVNSAFEELNKNGYRIEYIVNAFGLNHHIAKEVKYKEEPNNIKEAIKLLEFSNLNKYLEVNTLAVYNIITSAINNHTSTLKSVTTLGSIYTDRQPFHPLYNSPKSIGYVISKHALIGLNNYLASYLGKYKVRFNVVSPGCIMSEQPEDFLRKINQRTPLDRLSKSSDLYGIIKFLSSEESSYITGLDIKVDGGYSLY